MSAEIPRPFMVRLTKPGDGTVDYLIGTADEIAAALARRLQTAQRGNFPTFHVTASSVPVMARSGMIPDVERLYREG